MMTSKNYGTAFSDGVRIGKLQSSPYNFGALGMSQSPRMTFAILPQESAGLYLDTIEESGLLTLESNPPGVVQTSYQGYGGVFGLDCVRALKFSIQTESLEAPIVFTISGFDIWGHKVVENVTLPIGDDSTRVSSVKTYSYIKSIYASAGGGDAQIGISTGWGFGLPFYVGDKGYISSSFNEHLDYTVTLTTGQTSPLNQPVTGYVEDGTLTSGISVGDATDPATATTGDPRGVYFVDSDEVELPGETWLVLDIYAPGFDPMAGTVLAPNAPQPSQNNCYGVTQYSVGWQ